MIDPRLGELKRRLDELLSRCEATTLALQKNPDGEERAWLAAELRLITAEMNVSLRRSWIWCERNRAIPLASRPKRWGVRW